MNFFKIILCLFLTSCVSVPPGTGGTYFYNNYKTSHLIFQVPEGETTGTSEGACYLSIICLGDTTVSSAAKSAGIKQVTAVEFQFVSFLFLYSLTKIIVHGNKSVKAIN